MSITDNCAPTYAALNSSGSLWPCPDGNSSTTTCGAGGCEAGTGDNPLCMNLDASTPCCCPRAGCNAEPLFNWIVGVCKGPSCACGTSHAPSCTPQNQTGRCGSHCTGADVPCCFGADVTPLEKYYDEGTHAKVRVPSLRGHFSCPHSPPSALLARSTTSPRTRLTRRRATGPSRRSRRLTRTDASRPTTCCRCSDCGPWLSVAFVASCPALLRSPTAACPRRRRGSPRSRAAPYFGAWDTTRLG